MKLDPEERKAISMMFDPAGYAPMSNGQFEAIKLKVLLSIDARLEESNFYLQNQEERARNG